MSNLISLESCSFILNGLTVSGWSDDTDAFSPPNIEALAEKIGADGKMVVTSTGNKGGDLTIKLLPNSHTAKILMNAFSAQLAGAAVEWHGLFKDHRNGVLITFLKGWLKSAPSGVQIGKGQVGNLEFVFTFERIIPDYSGALFL